MNEETKKAFINSCTRKIIDGVVDIDIRMDSYRLEVLVRKVLGNELKRVLKAVSSQKKEYCGCIGVHCGACPLMHTTNSK